MIRRALINDLPRILEINNELKLDKWSRDKFLSIFDHDLEFWVFEFNGYVLGYIIGLVCLSEVRILTLNISQFYQRSGYARSLLKHTLADVRDNFSVVYALLEVDVSNFAAIALYTKLGFRILCVRKAYYTDTILRDAYLMQSKLN